MPCRSHRKGSAGAFRNDKSNEKIDDNNMVIIQRNKNKNGGDKIYPGGKLAKIIDDFFNAEDGKKQGHNQWRSKDKRVKSKTKSPSGKYSQNDNIDICNVGNLGPVFANFFNPGSTNNSVEKKKKQRASKPKGGIPKPNSKPHKVNQKVPLIPINMIGYHNSMSVSKCL